MESHNPMGLKRIGILHPGEMGISIAAAAQGNGHTVLWVSEGRSDQTHERASRFALQDAGSLAALCATSEILISVCPPHAAEAVAMEVLDHGYRGVYLDANAISPQRAARIGQAMAEAGIAFVDGGIIGGPAWDPGETWLYLSGSEAPTLAGCFTTGPLGISILGEEIGKASALKMCYAAYTKGTAALLCAILATAEQHGVRETLAAQWDRDDPVFAANAVRRARRVTAKAWRFAGEMEEIAATFREAGLPGDFHAAAAEIYRRIAHFKGAPTLPELDDLLRALSGAGEIDRH